MSQEKKKNYKKIGSLLDGKEGNGVYFKADDFKGELIYVDKSVEGVVTYYKIKTASLYEKHQNEPEFVKRNLVINLENDNQVELVLQQQAQQAPAAPQNNGNNLPF